MKTPDSPSAGPSIDSHAPHANARRLGYVHGCHALLLVSTLACASVHDHRQFDATIDVPFRAPAGSAGQARQLTLQFEFPAAQTAQTIAWSVEVRAPSGALLQRWYGLEALFKDEVQVTLAWPGPRAAAAADGIYQVSLAASAQDSESAGAHERAPGGKPVRAHGHAHRQAHDSELGAGTRAGQGRGQRDATRNRQRVDARATGVSRKVQALVERQLAAAGADMIEQRWPMQIGALPRPALASSAPLPTGAGRRRASKAQSPDPEVPDLPYTIYYGNLHSQTNHSDGGGALDNCKGAQEPQAAPFAPSDAYAFARAHGLDFLMTSEHNHLFDGSTGSNGGATPAFATGLFRSGLDSAAAFTRAHPEFLALYGMEWGVIEHGGHLNIFNSQALFGWEHNASGDLLADTFTPKGDYALLYSVMRARALLGQFNHPASAGQFEAGGAALGYSADGDAAMALCEVLNTSAFSANAQEGETRRSIFEGACQKALEAGFHVAFSSNQDNHCANWGAAYSNRTAILIPNDTALTQESFLEALQARRVFATMDKAGQLILTANGHIMGERFSNRGPLTLNVRYANGAGHGATLLALLEGVPGRHGTVSLLSSAPQTIITPTAGAHFYYARVTQDDGKVLWSAPVWVQQMPDAQPLRSRIRVR
ncbi:MAG: CehA/McbA family metallohydrolase [Pseudomonadota bacterium]